MTDRDVRVVNIRALMNLLADIERELAETNLRGEPFLAELRELRRQCQQELTLLETQKEELPQDND